MVSCWSSKKRKDIYYSFLILLCCLFACNPYPGIVHDARLYAFLAFLQLDPAAFEADLFAAIDTQRTYNLFGVLFAALIDGIGLSSASKTLVVAGLLAWLSGAWHLSRRLFRARGPRLGATLAAVALFLPYGLFHAAEAFATPRLFAEALGLHAVALAVAGRPLAGMAACLGAALLHPLMAPAPLAVTALLAARADRRWLALIPVGAVAVVALAWADLGPFATLGQPMNPTWLDVVRERNAYLFPSLWPDSYWGAVILQGGVLATVLISRPGATASAVYALGLGIGMAGLTVGIIGGDILADIFLIQIQPSRALWLTSVLAHMAAVHGVWLIWRRACWRLTVLAAWAAFVLTHGLLDPGLAVAIALMLGGLTLNAMGPRRGTTGPRGRVLRGSVVVVSGTALGVVTLVSIWGVIIEADSPLAVALSLHVVSLGLPVAAWLAHRYVRRPWTRFLVATVSTVLVVVAWDQRDAWTRHIESAEPPREVLAVLPEGRPVYWPGSIEAAWFLLRRPVYFDYLQGAGLCFDEEAADSFVRHGDHVARLEPRRQRAFFPPPKTGEIGIALLRPLSGEDIRKTCASAPDLASIILIHNVPALNPTRWDLPTPFTFAVSADASVPDWAAPRVYIYDCERVRDLDERE